MNLKKVTKKLNVTFGAVLHSLQPYLKTKAEEALQETHNRGSNREIKYKS